MQANVQALAQYRESILPYLIPDPVAAVHKQQIVYWEDARQAAAITDRAHALFLGGHADGPEFQRLAARLSSDYDWFTPAKFLLRQYREVVSMKPRLIQRTTLKLLGDKGQTIQWEISAVLARAGQERAAAIFVDNVAREIYGQRYFSGPNLNQSISDFIATAMRAIQTAYDSDAQMALRQGRQYPAAEPTVLKIKKTIAEITSE
jgi:hypothetical protein